MLDEQVCLLLPCGRAQQKSPCRPRTPQWHLFAVRQLQHDPKRLRRKRRIVGNYKSPSVVLRIVSRLVHLMLLTMVVNVDRDLSRR